MRRPGAEIPDQAFLPVRFGAKLEDLLLPEQIHRQSACDDERELSRLSPGSVLRIILKNEGVAGFVEFDKLAAQRWIRGRVAVFEVIHVALGERILFEELDDAERLAADGQNVHCTVAMALDDFDDFRGAAYPGNALGERQKDAEL